MLVTPVHVKKDKSIIAQVEDTKEAVVDMDMEVVEEDMARIIVMEAWRVNTAHVTSANARQVLEFLDMEEVVVEDMVVVMEVVAMAMENKIFQRMQILWIKILIFIFLFNVQLKTDE